MAGPWSLVRQVSRALPLALPGDCHVRHAPNMGDRGIGARPVMFDDGQPANAQEPDAGPAAERALCGRVLLQGEMGTPGRVHRTVQENHYPILKRLQAMGYIREISAAFPVNHAGEEVAGTCGSRSRSGTRSPRCPIARSTGRTSRRCIPSKTFKRRNSAASS